MGKKNSKGPHSLDFIELIPTPVLPQLDTGVLEDVEAEAEKIRKAATSIKEWVLNTLGKLEMSKGLSREGKELVEKQLANARKSLQEVLFNPVPAYRRAAWLGFFTFQFSRDLRTKEEVEEFLLGLVEKKYLEEVEVTNGDLKAYNKAYKVSGNSSFESQEIEETRKMFIDLLNRVWQEVGQTREMERSKLLEESVLSVEQFLGGKAGLFTLDIPAEEVKKPDGSTAYWRGGGTMKVKSDGKRVFPCASVGYIRENVEEARKMRIYDAPLHILLNSLRESRPPFIRGVPEGHGKKIQLIWHLLKRGLRHLEDQKQLQLSRQEMANKANVSPEEFFLEGKCGLCIIEHLEPWDVRSADGQIIHRVEGLFFLVSREEGEKEVKRIRIAEAPNHLKNFFASCISEEGYLEKGNKFEGIPYPLGAVLQATYGQVVKSAKIANTI
jgi:hypothetical protein